MKSGGIKYLAVGVVVVGGIAAVTYLNRAKKGSGELVQAVKRDQIPVRVVKVAPQDIDELIEHTGVLEADQDIVITAEVSGKIRRKLKQMGDPCKRGEALFQLDSESYRIARTQAQAQLQQSRLQRVQAQRDHRRTESLAKRKVVAGEALDRAETALNMSAAAVRQAEAALRMARRNLRETFVRCPFDGMVAETHVDAGQVIAPQARLARLVDTSQLKLKVKVSSAELARLKVGQVVSLYDPALPEHQRQRFSGKIARLGVAADATTRTFPVEVTLPGAHHATAGGVKARPGQVVRSSIVVAHHRGVLVVPEVAVAVSSGGRTLFVVEAGKAARREVTLGPRIKDRVVISGGLRPGEQVVVAGQHGLKPGVAVVPVGSKTPPANDKQAPADKKTPADKKVSPSKPARAEG